MFFRRPRQTLLTTPLYGISNHNDMFKIVYKLMKKLLYFLTAKIITNHFNLIKVLIKSTSDDYTTHHVVREQSIIPEELSLPNNQPY